MDTCRNGHPYDEANTYIDRHGWRHCRECRRLQQRSHYQARRQDPDYVADYRAKARARRAKYVDAKREYEAAYREKNREAIRAYHRGWIAAQGRYVAPSVRERDAKAAAFDRIMEQSGLPTGLDPEEILSA